jgi:hypothetical protein
MQYRRTADHYDQYNPPHSEPHPHHAITIVTTTIIIIISIITIIRHSFTAPAPPALSITDQAHNATTARSANRNDLVPLIRIAEQQHHKHQAQ